MIKLCILLIFCLFACSPPAITVKPVGHMEDKEFWDDFRRGYIGLDPDPYRLFVFQNIEAFENAPADIQQACIKKWNDEFPGEPWPPAHPPDTLPSATPPAQKTEDGNLRFVRDNIYTDRIWDFMK